MEWIANLLASIDPEDLKNAIENNENLVVLFFNHYKLADYRVRPIARRILKIFWEDLEDYLTNPIKVLEFLCKANPKLKPILITKRSIEWLNQNCENLYRAFYNYVFKDELPPEISYLKKKK